MAEDKNVAADDVTEDSDVEDSEESKTYNADYVKKLKAEAKGYRLDKAALKKERDEVKAALDKIEADKLTDSEKKDKTITDLTKQLEDIQGSIKQKEIDALVVEAISDKNIIDKPTMKLLIKQELASEEEIDSKVVDKIVDKLIKDKPFLINSTSVNPSDGNFAKQGGEPAKSGVQALQKLLNTYKG